jgi:hypothetical protein
MKLNGTSRGRGLITQNASDVEQWQSKKFADTPYYPLVRLLAEMFDDIATGINSYAVIGSTKNFTAFTLTLNQESERVTEYADRLTELARNATRLTSP